MQKMMWKFLKLATAALAIVVIFKRRKADDMTREEAADLLDRFLEGKTKGWEFGNFVDEYSGGDELLLRVSTEVCHINRDYPPEKGKGGYCNDEGMRRIRELAQLLRAESHST